MIPDELGLTDAPSFGDFWLMTKNLYVSLDQFIASAVYFSIQPLVAF
jgi:hypothetical protein